MFFPLLTHILISLVYFFAICAHFTRSEEYIPPINTTAISAILDRLTDVRNYDKRLRPDYGVGPVNVGITIHVSSISAVSEVDMDFTIDFYLRQTWRDPRLSFGESFYGFQNDKIESLTVGVDYLDKLWKPDTFFPNEKKSFFHAATTHNSFLIIKPDGTLFTSQRLTVTATCPMKLQLFPMDSQKCKLELESYAYTTATIDYQWCGLHNPDCSSAIRVEPIELPSYKLERACINKTVAKTSSGSYTRLWVQFTFTRESGSYVLQIFIPAILVVFISWVSFWINRESAPSRTVIGTLTVLSETHLLTGTNRRLPPVSYVKAVDVYLGFCYVIVVLALIEYACVAYAKKKHDDRNKKFRKQEKMRNLTIQLPTPDLLRDARIDGCTCNQDTSILALRIRNKNFRECIKHSRIDLIARILFPLSFFIFNFFYWTIVITLAGWFDFSNEESEKGCLIFD